MRWKSNGAVESSAGKSKCKCKRGIVTFCVSEIAMRRKAIMRQKAALEKEMQMQKGW